VKYNNFCEKCDFYGKGHQKMTLQGCNRIFLSVRDVTVMHSLHVYCCELVAIGDTSLLLAI